METERKRRKRSKEQPPAKATQRVELAKLPDRALEAVTDKTARLGELAKNRPMLATLLGVASGIGAGFILGLFLGARLLRA